MQLSLGAARYQPRDGSVVVVVDGVVVAVVVVVVVEVQPGSSPTVMRRIVRQLS